ncbi:OmpA family protein, partial [Vibrio parahaemolyticus]
MERDIEELFKYHRSHLLKERRYNRLIIFTLLIFVGISIYVMHSTQVYIVGNLASIQKEIAQFPKGSHGGDKNDHESDVPPRSAPNPVPPIILPECQQCDEYNDLSLNLTSVLINNQLIGYATPEEKNMLSEAIGQYLSGISNKLGQATADQMVTYFKDLNLGRAPKVMIHFDVGKYDIPISGREKLKGVCQKLDQSNRTIEVWGHADLTGNEASNLTLAKDRQRTVIQWIKDECSAFKGHIKANLNYKKIPIVTVSNQSEPGNRVV